MMLLSARRELRELVMETPTNVPSLFVKPKYVRYPLLYPVWIAPAKLPEVKSEPEKLTVWEIPAVPYVGAGVGVPGAAVGWGVGATKVSVAPH